VRSLVLSIASLDRAPDGADAMPVMTIFVRVTAFLMASTIAVHHDE
jgi:hypothetical protein